MKKLLMAGLTVLATTLPASAQLPDAKTLIAKYNTEVGTAEMQKHKSIHLIGMFELPAAGISAPIDLYRAQPNRSLQKVNIPGMGEIVRGFDGTTAWSINPMAGNQILTGKQLEQVIEESDFAGSMRDPKYVSAAETVEKTKMGTTDCYKVKLTWKSGRTTYDCYAVDTGLLVGTITSQDTPQGNIEVVSTMSEYKQFGGVKVPVKTTQSVMGQEQSLTISGVEFDKVDDATFAVPDAIKALVPKK